MNNKQILYLPHVSDFQLGLLYGLADALIYVTALQQKAKVVTGDSDFEGKEEVIFIK